MPTWKEKAESLSTAAGSIYVKEDPNDADMVMLGMKGLAAEEGCPAPFCDQAAKVVPDGVWGTEAQALFDMLEEYADSDSDEEKKEDEEPSAEEGN